MAISDPRTDPRQRVVDRVLAFKAEAVVAARKHGVPEDVFLGLVCLESAGNPEATRMEPRYRWVFGDDAHERARLRLPPGVLLSWDLALQRISYGLCQIMGAVAREYGYAGHLEALLTDVAANLDLGARHLANKIKQARGDLRQGLLYYNGGGDPAYPDKVLGWAACFSREPKPA